MSKDSFFTGRNQFDVQTESWPDWMCMQLIEASTRRIIVLQGHVPAAIKLQRLADVCAAAHVMPIEHWRDLPTATPAPADLDEHPGAASLLTIGKRWLANPTITFYLGFAIAWIIAGLGR